MGSIADLLGDQLRAGLAQLVDPDASDEAPGAAPASSETAVETAQDRAREAAPDRGRMDRLPLRLIGREALPHLEQGDVRVAPVGIALRRLD